MMFFSADGGTDGRKMRHRRLVASINITPVVDVVLVLLIVFMVTAPMLTTHVNVRLPQMRASAESTEKSAMQIQPVILTVDAEGNIFVGKTRISFDALLDHMHHMRSSMTHDPIVHVYADQKLHYGRVVDCLNVLAKAHFKRVMLMGVSR